MSIVLSFREDGDAHDRAKEVADAMGLPMQQYLLACIAEGHKVLKLRQCPSDESLDIPTFIRWGIPLDRQ